MQHAKESQVSSHPSGVSGNCEQGVAHAAEQQIVHQPGILQGNGRKFVRQGEHHVAVRYRQQVMRLAEPAIGLTLWAVSVAACNGVISITCLMGSFF
jgi:hypothetical protein